MKFTIPQREIFHIDWDQHMLYGWEKKKDVQRLASIVEGILNKNNFPSVLVHPHVKKRNVYFISEDEVIATLPNGRILVEGGHHRAFAHYLLSVPLKCELAPVPMRCYEGGKRNYKISDLKPEQFDSTYLKEPYKKPNLPALESALGYQDLIHPNSTFR